MPDTTDARPSTLIPLARDEQGNAIPIPAEAAFWRVRRQTKGRPRNICGVDREQLKLPLDFSAADLHNMLGPGTYRLDLHDSAGASLDVTVSATVGESEPMREANLVEAESIAALPNTTSDTRLVPMPLT